MIRSILILSWFLLCSIFPIPFSNFKKGTTVVPPSANFSFLQSIVNPTPGASDGYGFSVGISDNGLYAIVAADADDTSGVDTGYAYIYTRTGDTWALQQNLPCPTPSGYDHYGTDAEITADGLYAIVGAHGEDPSGVTDSGSIFVYFRTGSTWALQGTLSQSPPSGSAVFGNRATISDNGLYVAGGGYNYSSGIGTVSIFLRTGTTWALQQTLVNPTPASGDYFGGGGGSLSGDGQYFVVGAYSDDAGFANAGAAYVYFRTGTTWALQQTINNPTPAADDYFGIDTDISEDGTYFITAAHTDDTAGTDSGSAYIYLRTGTTWALQQTISNPVPGPIAGDSFGVRVSISKDGTYAFISAHTDDTIATNAGVVYVYKRSGTTWTLQQTITKPSTVAEDNFGLNPSISGDGLYGIIGAQDNSGGQTDSGAVYFFKR